MRPDRAIGAGRLSGLAAGWPARAQYQFVACECAHAEQGVP